MDCSVGQKVGSGGREELGYLLFPLVVCFSAYAVVAVRSVTESLRPLAFELNTFSVNAVSWGKFSTVNTGASNDVTFTWRCSFSVLPSEVLVGWRLMEERKKILTNIVHFEMEDLPEATILARHTFQHKRCHGDVHYSTIVSGIRWTYSSSSNGKK